MNLQIAQVYLHHSDPALTARTWQHVMETMLSTRTGTNLFRWQSAIRDKALEPLWQRKLIETTAEHFLAVLKAGTVSTNVYLRRIHNYAVNMHWLPWPVLPNRRCSSAWRMRIAPCLLTMSRFLPKWRRNSTCRPFSPPSKRNRSVVTSGHIHDSFVWASPSP